MKEVKELLRDPKILVGMIIVPLVMFPLMGIIIRGAMETTEERLLNLHVGLVDFDGDQLAQNLTAFLENAGISVIEIDAPSLVEAVTILQETEATDLITIPKTFPGAPRDVEVYSTFTGTGGFVETATSSVLIDLLEAFKRTLAPDPFQTVSKAIINGQPADVDPSILYSIVYSQVFALPVTISVLLIFSMQIAATSVASEKEEKTLETLLSLPINRLTILAGKLAGSTIVAGAGAVAIIVGFNYYMGSFMLMGFQGASVDLTTLGLAPTIQGYLVLGLSVFVALLSALALAIIISAFAEDVRSAQSIVGYLYVLIMLPMFITMFTDLNSLPVIVRIVLLALPYTHPMLAAQATLSGDYFTAVAGILYVSLFTIILLYIAAKLFATEKILTVKLKLKRLRLRKR